MRSFILISFLFTLTRCYEHDVTIRNYPRVRTLPVTEITTTGAQFNAEIIYRGDFKVISHGFVWDEDSSPSVESSSKLVMMDELKLRFNAKSNFGLKAGITYQVRSFIEIDSFLVYGRIVTFTSKGSTNQ